MRRRLNVLIKLAIAVTFAVVVGYQLLHDKDTGALWEQFLASWSAADGLWIALAVALMPLCWWIEAAKWRVLMRPALSLSWRDAIRTVLGGVAVSLFTPNRIGEYGGRILFVPATYNWRAVVATFVGSFGQNIVQVFTGLVAVCAFLFVMPEIPLAMRKGFVLLIGIMLCVGLWLYFRLPMVGEWLVGIAPPRWLRRPWLALRFLKKLEPGDLRTALLYSLLKYLVFSTQFVILLHYFGVEIPVVWLFSGVAVMYLMQTSIPMPPFVDVVVRGELAILLWSSFGINELSVFAASFFIWIINLLIPAFFGLAAISSVNVLQSLGYETKNAKADPDSSSTDAADRPVGHRT